MQLHALLPTLTLLLCSITTTTAYSSPNAYAAADAAPYPGMGGAVDAAGQVAGLIDNIIGSIRHGHVKCTPHNPSAVAVKDRFALKKCWTDYKTMQNWDGQNCGGKGWFKGHAMYDSPDDCVNACDKCLQESIAKGVGGVLCDHYATSFNGAGSRCWAGF